MFEKMTNASVCSGKMPPLAGLPRSYSCYHRQTQSFPGNSKPNARGFLSVIEMKKTQFCYISFLISIFNYKTVLCRCKSYAGISRFMNLPY